jgi:hypothetical protein
MALPDAGAVVVFVWSGASWAQRGRGRERSAARASRWVLAGGATTRGSGVRGLVE